MIAKGRTANSIHSSQKLKIILILASPIIALIWLMISPPSNWLLYWVLSIGIPFAIYWTHKLALYTNPILTNDTEFRIKDQSIDFTSIQAITEKALALHSVSLLGAFPSLMPFQTLSNQYFRIREFTVVSRKRDLSFGYLEMASKMYHDVVEREYLQDRSALFVEEIKVFPMRRVVLIQKEQAEQLLESLVTKTGLRIQRLSSN